MLLVDGVSYRLSNITNEEELETYIESHSRQIFGPESLYFPVKKQMKSMSGIGSIPDGYVVMLSRPYRWLLVEVELSNHPIYEHIVPQLNKFVQGIKNPDSKKQLVKALLEVIRGDQVLEAYVKKQLGSGELHEFLSNTIDQSPELAVIIDNKTTELLEACDGIPLNRKHILEFQVYETTDVGLKNAFLFTSLTTPDTKPKQALSNSQKPEGDFTHRPEFTLSILETLMEMGGKGNWVQVLSQIGEKMKDRLTLVDKEFISDSQWPLWKDNAYFRVQELKRRGYMKKGTPRGQWEISEEGKMRLQKLKKQ
jgi:hypothetical protein